MSRIRLLAVFGLVTAVPSEAALSIELSMHDEVVVEPSLLGPRKAQGCSSQDGPFCPHIGLPLDAANDGILWRILLASQVEGLSVEETDGFIDWETPALVDPQQTPHDSVHELPKTASLDLTTLPPWINSLPKDFSDGIFPRVTASWEGDWHVVTASRGHRATWTAVELRGLGGIKFSRPVVVSELLLQTIQGPFVVIGYLNREAVWRRRIKPGSTNDVAVEAWQNGARGLWAVDELGILPISSVILGSLVVASSDSSSDSGVLQNDVPVTLLTADAHESPGPNQIQAVHISISNAAPVLTLREAWQQGLTITEPHRYDDGHLSHEPPSLEDVQDMFQALQEGGMQLPDGITWAQIEAEADHFHTVMSKYAQASNIRRWWKKMWNAHRFTVLEVCVLKWVDAAAAAKESQANVNEIAFPANETNVSGSTIAEGTEAHAILQLLLGNETSTILSRLMSHQDPDFIGSLEEALLSLLGEDVPQLTKPQEKTEPNETAQLDTRGELHEAMNGSMVGSDSAELRNSTLAGKTGIDVGMETQGLAKNELQDVFTKMVRENSLHDTSEGDSEQDEPDQQIAVVEAQLLKAMEVAMQESLQQERHQLTALTVLILMVVGIALADRLRAWTSDLCQAELIWV